MLHAVETPLLRAKSLPGRAVAIRSYIGLGLMNTRFLVPGLRYAETRFGS